MSDKAKNAITRFITNALFGPKVSPNRFLLIPIDDENEEKSHIFIEEIEDKEEYRNNGSKSIKVDLVPRILESAQGYADGEELDCKFIIKSDFDEDISSKIVTKSDVFKISPSDGSGNDKYAPTQNGIMRLLMKDSQELRKMNVQLMQAIAIQSTSTIRNLRDENEHLRNIAFENIKLQQDLLDRTQQRQLEATKAEQQAKILGSIGEGVAAMLPIVAGKFIGINKIGADVVKQTPQYQALKGLFSGKTPEQMDEMADWFGRAPMNPADKAALGEIVASIIADVEPKEKEDKDKPPPNGGNNVH